MTAALIHQRFATRLLSPQNASLLRLAVRSVRRDPKRSFAVGAVAGGPVGLAVAFQYALEFRFHQYQLQLSEEVVRMLQFGLLPITVGVVVVAAFTVAVRGRTRELGQLVVVGADGSQIRRLVVLEALVVVAAGTVLGFVVGIGGLIVGRGSLGYNGRAVDLSSAGPILLQLLVGLGLAAAAASIPAWRASALAPVAALGSRVPEQRQRWWPVVVALAVLLGLVLWRIEGSWFTNSGRVWDWGIAVVWSGFAVLVLTLPRIVRRVAAQADRLPGLGRLALRDLGRSTVRASSVVVVALAASTLGVMAVAGLESDQGTYEQMDARYVLAHPEHAAWADDAVAELGSIEAVATFDVLKPVERPEAGRGEFSVAALSDKAMEVFGLDEADIALMPPGGALVLNGYDWPMFDLNGRQINFAVVDADVGGSFDQLPSALMRQADLESLPGEAAPSSVRVYTLREPLTDSQLREPAIANAEPGRQLFTRADFDYFPFGLSFHGFVRLLIGVPLGLVVLAALGLTRLGVKDVDAQLRPMLDMGAATSIRRRFLAMQTGTLVLIGGLLGSCLGVVLFWIVTRGDRSVPDPIVPWTAVLALTIGAAVLSAAVVAALFGPNTDRTAVSPTRTPSGRPSNVPG